MELISKIYTPLVKEYYLYNVFFGGRGGGKSENVAACLVILATQQKRRILCIRESQNSIDESVKAMLEKWIFEFKLDDLFDIYKTTIRCKNGSEFLFMGMRSHTAVSVKSITDINITWIEEAEAFSKRSWTLLRPSVVRTKEPRIIITFNPLNDDDIVYETFVKNKPPELSCVKLINPEDNPFFKGSMLEKQMQSDKERLPADEFEHIWHGKLASTTADSLFRNCDMSTLEGYTYDRADYAKIVVACDPATTHKDHSNEYGIVVCGKTKQGEYHILDDFSGNMVPLAFCAAVQRAQRKWAANLVIVEVNNGGDFIKASLIEYDSTLLVREVRASRDKVQRAMPVANLMELGKLHFAYTLPKLARQMRLMTIKGYKGSLGESPDRLDACVWALYDLAEIRDKDTIYTVFKPQWTEINDFHKKADLIRSNLCFLSQAHNKFVGVVCSFYRLFSDSQVVFNDSFVVDTFDEVPDGVDRNKIVVEDIPLNDNLIGSRYAPINEKNLDILVSRVLPVVKQGKAVFSKDFTPRLFENFECNLLENELMEYKPDSERKFYLMRIFCDAIFTLLGLNKD